MSYVVPENDTLKVITSRLDSIVTVYHIPSDAFCSQAKPTNKSCLAELDSQARVNLKQAFVWSVGLFDQIRSVTISE